MTTGKLQTLDRGIEALLLVAKAPEGLTVSNLATRLGLHRAVTYRIVATLADRGMVRRVGDGCIVLGANAYLLGGNTVGRMGPVGIVAGQPFFASHPEQMERGIGQKSRFITYGPFVAYSFSISVANVSCSRIASSAIRALNSAEWFCRSSFRITSFVM